MLLLTLSALAGAVECPDPVAPDALASLTREATLAWVALDSDAFSEHLSRIEAEVPCLSAPVSPDLAAQIHGLRGMRAFLEGDRAAATLSFQAADAADPKYRLSDRVAPRGGRLQRLQEEATRAARDPGEPLALLDGGTIWVDGVTGGPRSAEHPALVQVGAGERAVWSTLLAPGARFDPPAAALADLPRSPIAPATPSMARSDSRGGTALWAAAGGSGAVAAGLLGTSAYLRTRYDAAPTQGLHTATNGTFVASTGMAAVTGGLLTAAIVRARRTSR